MTTTRTGGATEALNGPPRKNFLHCALRILVVPSLPAAENDRVVDLLREEACPQQLAEYLWEHYLEELVVHGRDDLDLALERIAAAFAMLDESDRCAPTPPLLWLDVSQPLTANDRRLR